MSYHNEGVNPLRPYYIPPTIGEGPDLASSPSPNPFATGAARSSHAGNATSHRAILDVDYRGALGDDAMSVARNVKDFVDELLWKYTSVLMAQPFEVAKTILQVRSQEEATENGLDAVDAHKRSSHQRNPMFEYDDDDSDGEEPAYFTSNSNFPSTPTPSHSRGHSLRVTTPSPQSPLSKRQQQQQPTSEAYLVIRKPDSVTETIGQLWSKEGAWGVWKGSNATFLYSVLQSLLENWSTSFFSAVLNVPDIGMNADIDRLIDVASPYPWTSVFVAGAAAVATGLVLAPLDLIRTRLILTPTTKGNRRTLKNLRSLPSYLCPPTLLVPTALHSLVHPILTLSTPLVLRTRFMIDSAVSPMTFSLAKFLTSSAAILIKLPLETVLRRGQMAVLSQPGHVRALEAASKGAKFEPIVPPGRYFGVLGTMYHIALEEGVHARPGDSVSKKGKLTSKGLPQKLDKGQGLEGLCRGWKVNWWGLVGLWAAAAVGNGGEGEF